MMSYANLHFALQKSRQHAEDTQSRGPRVLILGSENAGKTTLAKILIGYAVRQGSSPIVVGLDPKQARPHENCLTNSQRQSSLLQVL